MKFVKILFGALGLLLCLFSALSATIINVPDDQPTIQAGVDAAASGDTILLKPGIYTGDGNNNIRLYDKSLVIIGTAGPDSTIIDVIESNQYAFFCDITIDERITFDLSDVSITNASCGIYSYYGIITFNLENVVIHNCTGWAINVFGGSVNVNVNNCEISNNINGISSEIGEVFIGNSDFYYNSGTAMGICAYNYPSDTTLIATKCRFVGNNMAIAKFSPGRVDSCTFDSNQVSIGGEGIYSDCNFTHTMQSVILMGCCRTMAVYNSVFETNYGNIARIGDMPSSPSSILFDNCQFSYNNGGVSEYGMGARSIRMYDCTYIYNDSPVVITFCPSRSIIENCTFAYNSNGAIRVKDYYEDHSIANNIFYNNSYAINADTYLDSSYQFYFGCCDVYSENGDQYIGIPDHTGINGNISADPQFCDLVTDDYTINLFSPCAPENNSCNVLMGSW
ncbi:MAG: right-handed parallel beta-helix repeat-containing protein, partial [Candidatus Zixiibacteriota bacterium]